MGAALFISKWLQSIGCQYTTAGKNAFITGAYVVIVPFFMRLLFKTRLSAVNMAAAVLALAGIGIISVAAVLEISKAVTLLHLEPVWDSPCILL